MNASPLNASPMNAVDEEFVRRAVDEADLNALRIALFQATRDPELGAIELQETSIRGGSRKQLVVAPEHQDWIKQRAVRFLLHEASGHERNDPTADEVDALIEMAHGEPVAQESLRMRRDLVSFGEFPLGATWTTTRPTLPEGFEVVIVGAGFSGIGMAVQLSQLGVPFTILERRDEIGGVWSVNTYPDARVDTLSSTYQYAFEKNYPWTEYFARQPEVRGYLEHIAKKYGAFEHIRFGHDVVEGVFDEASSTWSLQVETATGEVTELTANVVVSAAGLFALPKPFEAEGVDDFAGELLHTTEWELGEHTARGKRVAVIGNGSTGVQILGRIAEEAEEVFVFQRTPQWIQPRERYGEAVTPESAWLLDAMPYYWNWSRYVSLMPGFNTHDFVVPDAEWIATGGHVNERNDGVRAGLVKYIRRQVGDRQDLVDRLVPDYAPFARRPVVDNGWYRALTRDNVELVTTPISRLTQREIETDDGLRREVDLVITAVGFRTTMYLYPTDYRGLDGASLQELWGKDGPRAHMGMTVPGFPNFFMLYGPNSQPVSGHGSLPAWFEIWTHYIAQCLVGMLESGSSRIEIRQDTYDDYNVRLDAAASGLVHLQDAGSRDANYYLNEWGRMQVNAPWDGEGYYTWCANPDLSEFTLS